MAKPDPKLLDLLVCPLTHGPLKWERDPGQEPGEQWLVSPHAKLRFPVRDGIPILLESEAKPIDETPAAPELSD